MVELLQCPVGEICRTNSSQWKKTKRTLIMESWNIEFLRTGRKFVMVIYHVLLRKNSYKCSGCAGSITRRLCRSRGLVSCRGIRQLCCPAMATTPTTTIVIQKPSPWLHFVAGG